MAAGRYCAGRKGLCLVVLLGLGAAVAWAQENPYPELNPARVAALAALLPAQPAGFGPACSDRAAWSAAAPLFAPSVKQAEKFAAKPLPAWDDQAYLRFSRDGDRRTGEAMLRRHTEQLTPLVLAECSEWKGRFLPRIAEQLDAISAEPSWTLPAHDPKLENFSQKRFYVDLNSATLSHNVAEALYLLGDKIPAATRERAMAALERHVFSPMRLAFAGHKEAYVWWMEARMNWSAVCYNGVTGAALAILPDRGDRALFAAAAERWVPDYLYSFSDSGYDTEGIGYWVYGFSNFAMLRENLWRSTGGRADLFDNPKARKAALFGFQFAMLPGVYADFGDAHFGYRPDEALLAHVDRTFSLGEFADDLAILRKHDSSLADATQAAFPLKSQRHDSSATANDLIGLRAWYPENGILVDRPAAGGNFAITIKAGGNTAHSHNDVGSYSIGMGSTQVVGDPGGPGVYVADTFNSKRYTYRLLNSFGHPVPEIDGKLQLEATRVHPTVLSTDFTAGEDTIVMDITPAYAVRGLKKVIRTMKYTRANGGSVEITDEFDLSGSADIVEPFPTHGEWKQIDGKSLRIDFGDGHVEIAIDAPGPLAFTEDKVNDMGNPFTRIGAAVHLEQSGKVVMRFRPVR